MNPARHSETRALKPTPLARRREPPPGGEIRTLKAFDGVTLRVMLWPDGGEHGSIAIVPGRAEFIERYFEVAAELRERGFAVAILDHRNHGLSGRPLANPQKHHLHDFAPMVEDLGQILDTVIATEMPAPVSLLAHSMGAHIALRLLHDRPAAVARAVLTAPMIGIRTLPLPSCVAAGLAAGACGLGYDDRYAPGQKDWETGLPRERLRRRLTSDADRFADEEWQILRKPALKLGGVTFGWLDAAYRSIRLLARPGYAEAIATPALFVLAEREKVVDNTATRRFARRMPAAEIVEIAGAMHEILRERDVLRQQFWRSFDGFMSTV